MRDYIILTDSTSDLTYEMRQQYGIEYVPMQYIIDGVEYKASLDWESHNPKEYYDLMRNGTRVFTSQILKDTYYEAFHNAISEGKDVIYIACSSALSASINVARLVAMELTQKHPEAGIYCIDSLISSLGQGYLAMEASRKRAAGLSAADTAAYIESIKLCVNQCGTVSSLEYLRRAGRVKASKAFFGNLFGVKPIIISDIKGQNYAYKKAKGTLNARIAIAEHIRDAANGVYEELFLTHADCEEDILLLRDEILKIAPFKNVTVSTIGPIVGASVGPGTVIAFCHGTEVTIEGNE
ncbi:MAG: DegV family protein [Oscillospiraceae bacterium]|nr:DegV family protein [Oscillospiraceae bacterium]